MVAVVDGIAAPVVPLPRTRYTAMVVGASAARRGELAARMRSTGAREVVEAATAAEARVRALTAPGRDLCLLDGSVPDAPVLPLVSELRRHGWRRVVLLTGRHDAYAVRAALVCGVRAYVVVRPPVQAARPAPPVRPRGRAGTPDELSAREVEVLQQVADGRSNREAGEHLGLSALTVKSHLARIARKLGTGDRAAMVAIGLRSSLIR